MQDDQQPAPAENEHVDQPEAPQPEANDAPPARKSVRESFEEAWAKDLDAPEDTELKSDEAIAADAPARGPDGKFIAKDKPEGDEPQEAEPEGKAEDKAEKPRGEHAEPPTRFSADAKGEWEKAPESVRAEAHRAIREMEAGLQRKDEQIKPLEPFFQMAEKGGVKLDQALARYVNMETALRNDPVKGLTELAQNLGKTPQELGHMLMGQQQEGQPDPRDQKIASLEKQVSELSNNFQGVSRTVQEQREQSLAQEISAFAATHPRLDELGPEIARMIETGYATSLPDAYEKAERMNPPAQHPEPAPQVEDAPQTAPAQTRKPQSLTGAPSPGSNPASSRAPSKSPREALSRAFGL